MRAIRAGRSADNSAYGEVSTAGIRRTASSLARKKLISLASFRESSELEYGADSCFVLVPGRDDPESVALRCLKHRHGEPVSIALRFERRFQRFTPIDATPSESERAATMGKLAALWNRTPAAADDGGES